MSPHAVDDDCSGWAQQQGGHDDNGGQDDEDNDPDIQDVLGKHSFCRGLADSIHAPHSGSFPAYPGSENVHE